MKYNIAIGYDRNNRMPAYTMAESLLHHSSVPLNIMYLHRNNLKVFDRPDSPHDSTDFSNSRFLVPYLYDYEGWTLYLDNDMIALHDIKELFDYRDDKYAVMVVKHNQQIRSDKKFLDKKQYQYQYKNWSSVMLFNNEQCKALTPYYVNTASGLDMHQFKWLGDHSLIGDLPLEWNYLVDNANQTTRKPKLVHYTDGGPYFRETYECGYAQEWINTYVRINDVGR